MTNDIAELQCPNPPSRVFAIEAADGYRLAATLFPAPQKPLGRIIVAGATAVPQGFYRRFAEFAAARGFETVTFDYRGIGLSRPATLKGFRMSLLDWGQLDLAAIVESTARNDGLQLYMVGHSFGGHALGMLPNHHLLNAFYGFGIGAGWHGWMPLTERFKVLLMWHLLLPTLTWWKGYCPWKMLGMGEDLPKDVFWQWRHWCKYPRYFFDDPEMQGIEGRYARVTVPIVAANALDDRWATVKSRDAFMSGYQNAPMTRREIAPHSLPGGIGHMGYFRPSAQALWYDALEWLSSPVRNSTVPSN